MKNKMLIKRIVLYVTCILTVTVCVALVNNLITTGLGPDWFTNFLEKFIFLAYTIAAILGFVIVFGFIALMKSLGLVLKERKK